MIEFLAAYAVGKVVEGMAQAQMEGANAVNQRNARALSDSSASKAAGTEAIYEGEVSSQQQAKTLRQSLQLQGAQIAASDSAGVDGQSIREVTNDIQLQADMAMEVARQNAKNKIGATNMANKSRYEASLYSVKSFEPTTLGDIAFNAAVSTAVTYFAANFAGGE
jgi:hypothetical protein